jgi:lysine 2,3-aminomutase
MSNDADRPPSTTTMRGCESNAAAVQALTRRLISSPGRITAPGTVAPKKRPSTPRFPIGEGANAFRKRFFPQATLAEWNDWHWQARNRIRTLDGLARILVLSEDERSAIEKHTGSLPVGITPYYLSLFDRDDANDPLRRTHVPVGTEYVRMPGEEDDPLGEDHDTEVEGLVHRYPDRVLFLTTGFCSTYCRYCTRSRMVGEAGGEYNFNYSQWENALAYLRRTPQVRDVLLSGGDPLTLSDERLDWLLTRLREIPHIEFVRIGSKVPVVLPQRITAALAKILRRHRVWLSVHYTHPSEITPEVRFAADRLADAGIPMGSQTVLLKGINDDPEIMKSLMHGLLKIRVKPYYLYQCDPITGSSHFRTSVDKGLEIIEALRGHTTGYAVPHYVIDAPGGGGKVPLLPDYVVGREGDDLLIRNFEGNVYRYADPAGRVGADRQIALPRAAE